MGIAIAVIGAGILGTLFLIGILVGGYFLVGRVARPEARKPARRMILALTGAAGFAAFISSFQFESGNARLSSNWQEVYCGAEVGEVIYRTVDNVGGVFYDAPAPNPGAGHFHSDESRPEKYLGRPGRSGRRYDYFEARFAPGALVQRYELQGGKTVSSRHNAPTARYAFTWTPLGSAEMRKDGVAGEELEIYDRETREVLARRIFYYYQSSRRQVAYGAPIPVCPQIKLPKDPAYIGGQPRNSYEFVARVLKPPSAWPDDARDFALVRGGGRQVKECAGGYVWIGPGLAATDLAFARQDQNLIVTVAGSSDSLLCRGYFSSGGGPGMAYRLRFFDSGPFSDDELRAKLAPEGRKAP